MRSKNGDATVAHVHAMIRRFGVIRMRRATANLAYRSDFREYRIAVLDWHLDQFVFPCK